MKSNDNQTEPTKRAAPQRKTIWRNIVLLFVNIILVVGVVFAALFYSNSVLQQKSQMKVSAFCTMMESMKQVSENYLISEKGYVDDWAQYISNQHMTVDEALDYIRSTNTHADRVAHIVNLEDWSARTTYYTGDKSWVHNYEKMYANNQTSSKDLLKKMQENYDDDNGEINVIGKYRSEDIQRTVVSVGARVTIREKNGKDKDYLLLRLMPVEYLQKAWAHLTNFANTEISLIVRDGGYVVQAPGMRGRNFLQFIRSYNFPDDYNKMYDLEKEMANSDTGLLQYKNSTGTECYYYYSALTEGSDIRILGSIPVSKTKAETMDWSIILIICGTILVLVLINGTYIYFINRNLRKTAEIAEAANMAKTQFLSAMSHDIRTPMNAVLGMTEIAKHHIDDPKYVKACLDKISVSGNHLLTLINDILDISKVESGEVMLNITGFSLKEMLGEINLMIALSARKKDLSYRMELLNITKDRLMGDPLRIRQVLINLLTNAVKYTDEGGYVLFSVREHTGENSDTISLEFLIEDNGIGMSEAFQKNMYASFTRATDSRINTIQGFGLGLAIAHQMVDLMDGTISCVSEEGKGTAFTVVLQLPVSEETPQEELPAAEEAEQQKQKEFRGMRVLVVEDNDLNWEIIHVLLSEYGILSDRVENGQRCLDRLNNEYAHRYEAVLMDVQMPIMNGREATRQMRQSDNPYIKEMPVIAMTADAFAEDVQESLAAGMNGHIPKPVDINQVLTFLRKIKNHTL